MAPLQLHRIHLAVLQHDLPRVRRLLHRKASYIDLQDSKGATPLMLAAFIGSAKLVTFLLKKRASWQTTDRMGNSASDYVRGPFADQMRDCYKSYMRNSSTKSPRQRRDLEEHLRDDTALETQYRRTALGTLSFRRHGSSVSISKLIATVKFAGPLSDNTTAGCIAAGGSVKPLTCAVSGWTTTNLPGALNGAEYTDMVRNIAEILEFDLPRHCYDTPGGGTLGENIGRFHASHCEKLLAAFWVSEQLKFAFGAPDLSRLRDLQAVDLPSHRQKASIFIDHLPCVPCRLFLAAIQNATGIQITVFPQPLVKKVVRGKRSGSCKNCTCAKCKIVKRKDARSGKPNTADLAGPGGA